MPWDVTIRREDCSPLGDREVVRQQITDAVPGFRFYREAGGAERIAAARAIGIEYPEALRQMMERWPSTEKADFQQGGLFVRPFGFESQPLHAFHAEVRGDGNPVPLLAALCLPNGWVAADDAGGVPIGLAGDSAAGWEIFRSYRDRADRDVEGSG